MQNLKLIPRHLNQDSQKDGYSQSFYYDALNIKLITDEKNGYCVISPERSSKLIYTIADHINFNGYIYIPKKILGIVEYGDIDNMSFPPLLVFIAAEKNYHELNPNGNYYGVLQALHFYPDGEFATSDILFAGDLNFEINHDIKAYSLKKKNYNKVYFSDGYNPLRHVSINSDIFSLTVEKMDIVSNSSLGNIAPIDVVGGGQLKAGKIYYAIQYFDVDGSESNISQISTGVVIYETSTNVYTSAYITGSPLNTMCNKSVRIQLYKLNKTYDYFRLYAIHYNNKDLPPEIRVVSEYSIDKTSEEDYIEVIDSGTALYTIEPELFSELGKYAFVCNDFCIKEDRLIAVGIQEEQNDINYDARVYRYEYNSDSTYITGNPLNVPENADCINPDSTIYKYKKNSTKLGGTGVNIEYEFKLIPLEVGQFNDDYTEFKVIKKNINIQNLIGNYYFNNASNININYFGDGSDPVLSELFVGYKRGEIYRFGIEFLDSRNRRYKVKWIGDIKFPDMYERSVGYHTYSIDGNVGDDYKSFFVGSNKKLYFLSLGIIFKVRNVPLDKYNKVYSYRIVRAERTIKDKTRITQGLISSLDGDTSKNISFPAGYFISKYSEDDDKTAAIKYLKNSYHCNLITPEDKILKYTSFKGYTVKPIAGIKFKPKRCGSTNNYYDGVENMPMNYYNLSSLLSEEMIHNPSIIDSETIIATNDIANIPKANIGDIIYYNVVMDHNYDYLSIFPTTTVLGLDDTLVTNEPFINTLYDTVLLADIEIQNSAQYGGNTYYQRKFTIYKTCGHFRSSIINNNYSDLVFGGDTYISLYDINWCYPTAAYYRKDTLGGTENDYSELYTYSSFVLFPIESSINLALRHDKSYIKTGGYLLNTARGNKLLQEFAGNYAGKVGYGSRDDNSKLNYSQDYDLFLYNNSYSSQENVIIGLEKQLSEPTIYLGKNTVKVSDYLTSNISDNYIRFPNKFMLKTNNNLFAVTNYKQYILLFEANAVGLLKVNFDVMTQTTTGLVSLRKEKEKIEFEYLSSNFGTIYTDSVVNVDSNIFFVDTSSKLLTVLSDGFTQILGLTNLFKNNITLSSKIKCILDDKRLFVINNNSINSFIVSYNFETKGFVSRHDYIIQEFCSRFDGKLYITNGLKLFIHNDDTTFNKFTDNNNHVSSIKFLISPFYKQPKEFVGLDFSLNDNQILPKKIKLETSYQHTERLLIAYNDPNISNIHPADLKRDYCVVRKRFNKQNLIFPRIKGHPDDKRMPKLYDNYLFIEIILNDSVIEDYIRIEDLSVYFDTIFNT